MGSRLSKTKRKDSDSGSEDGIRIRKHSSYDRSEEKMKENIEDSIEKIEERIEDGSKKKEDPYKDVFKGRTVKQKIQLVCASLSRSVLGDERYQQHAHFFGDRMEEMVDDFLDWGAPEDILYYPFPKDYLTVTDLAVSDDYVVYFINGSEVVEFDYFNGEEKKRFQCEGKLTQIAVQPSDKPIESRMLVTAVDQRETVQCWDVNTGQLIRTLEGNGTIKGLKFFEDGNRIIAMCQTTGIFVWDTQNGYKLAFYPSKSNPMAILGVRGSVIVTNVMNSIRVLNDRKQWTVPPRGEDYHIAPAHCISVDCDKESIVTGSSDSIMIRHMNDPGYVKLFLDSTGVWRVMFHPRYSHLIVMLLRKPSNYFCVFDIVQKKSLITFADGFDPKLRRSFRLSKDGSRLFIFCPTQFLNVLCLDSILDGLV